MPAIEGRDLSFLPAELQRSAQRVGAELMEVMWPIDAAEAVINALASEQMVVLGLDLRSDGSPGLATELPWGDFTLHTSDTAVEDGRRDAIDALRRPDIGELASAGYRWVLITWDDVGSVADRRADN